MISKIIGLDSGTRKRAIVSIVTAILDFLSVFGIVKFSDAQIEAIKNIVLVVLTAIIWAIGFYYNECTTPENCELTGVMRANRKKGNYAVTEEYDEEEVGGDAK